MKVIRRLLLAAGALGCVAGARWLRGTGGRPPQTGGWRELREDERSPAPPSEAGTPAPGATTADGR